MSYRSTLALSFIALAAVPAPAIGQRIMPDVQVDEHHMMADIQTLDQRLFEQMVKDVPKLDVVVRIPEGALVPSQLQQFVVKDGMFAGKRLRISGEAETAIAAALMTPEFHAEFERPNSLLQPILEIGPNNLDARRSHFVPEFEATFISVRGAGITVGLFDEGLARPSHQEFAIATGSRISKKTSSAPSRHSTHCAGTIAAKGVRPQAIGMATQASLSSYDWNNDLENLDRDAASLQVSSHSYGPLSGWVPNYPLQGAWNWWGGEDDTEDARYGKYTDECSALDDVLSKHTHLVTVFAAGNDRGMGPDEQPIRHFVVSSRQHSTKTRDITGGDHGLDCISGAGLAKNAICIGALDDILTGGGASAIKITSFSGVGPSDDGRIKPDLVANGYQLLSTSNNTDTAYAWLSGTSMATPTASGIAALLCELYKSKHGKNPSSAEIKAALIHTARDGGVAGPDPQYGWGSIDAHAAGMIIDSQIGSLLFDPEVFVIKTSTDKKTFSFEATGDPVRVTIVWIDPPAEPNPGSIDDATSTLVNDLDLSVISPNGTVYMPYGLDLSNLWDAATGAPKPARTDRPNRVDNVEMIEAVAASGTWRVEVVGNLSPFAGAGQPFALAISGLKPAKP